MTSEERAGLEKFLMMLADGREDDSAAVAWLRRQLEHDDWDKRLERMGGGKKARDARMKPLFDARCAVTAFDMHAQVTDDGRMRGLWLWLLDESKARAQTYDQWCVGALDLFCTLAGVDDDTREKFRMSSAMSEFKNVANARVHEAALLEWPVVKRLYAVLGEALQGAPTIDLTEPEPEPPEPPDYLDGCGDDCHRPGPDSYHQDRCPNRPNHGVFNGSTPTPGREHE